MRIQNLNQTIIHLIPLQGLPVLAAVFDCHIVRKAVIGEQLAVRIEDIAARRGNRNSLLRLLQIVFLIGLSIDNLQMIEPEDHDAEQAHVAEAEQNKARGLEVLLQPLKTIPQKFQKISQH